MVDWPLGEAATPKLDELNPALRDHLVGAAVGFLHSQTGYGLRNVVVEPRWTIAGPRLWRPLAHGGVRVQCEHCLARPCHCTRLRMLRFGFRVDSVTHVTVEDETVDPDSYRLLRSRVLERVDGWPRTGMTVHLAAGTPVPAGGQIAAAVLAEEFAKAVAGDDECALPQRVQTITRQGVTVGMMDGMEDLDDGRTGIWLVDSWVASVRNQPSGGVFSPDLPPLGGWGG